MKPLVPGMSCIELSCSPKETPQKPPNKPDYCQGYCLFSTNWWQGCIILIEDNSYITHWTLKSLAGAYLETFRLFINSSGRYSTYYHKSNANIKCCTFNLQWCAVCKICFYNRGTKVIGVIKNFYYLNYYLN